MRLIVQLLSLLVRGTALMLGLVGSVLALASLGGAISPKLDALTHITPLWLAMGVGAVLLGGLFARDAERWVMVGLGAVAISASGVAHCGQNVKPVMRGRRRWRGSGRRGRRR